MNFTIQDLARITDLTAVRADTDEAEVRALAQAARTYRTLCVCTLPGFTPLLRDLLADEPDVRIVGAVGFPSGGHTTAIKVAEARELLDMGCSELDMVANIGLLRSGAYQRVLDDICAVVEVAGQTPVKVILECHYLTEEQIRVGCELCIQAGAAFVKTSTGWAPTGATLENVALIKACVGDRIAVKAAGGIRDLETVTQMYRLGARRFGIGLSSALKIFESL
ncbi:MAG: deoxyribose-phosphate aldolase [Anaerolineae bacterium]